jgi:hypothetical protein
MPVVAARPQPGFRALQKITTVLSRAGSSRRARRNVVVQLRRVLIMIGRFSILLAAFALAACNGDSGSSKCTSGCTTENQGGEMIHGSGVMKTETRPAEKFTAVVLSSSANVVIERTGTESLTVTGDDNLIPLFLSQVRDGTLYLSFAKGKSFEGKTPVYRIGVIDLRTLTLDGAGDIDASKLEAGTLSVFERGSGDIRLAGEVGDLAVAIDGSGNVNAAKLKAKRAKVAVNGSGDARVNVSDELDAKITGSGDISYLGSPKVTSNVSGSGSIKPKP